MKQKRILAIMLSLAMILSMLPTFSLTASAAASFAGGDGTENNPYQIATLTQLEAFRDDVNDGNSYSGMYVKLLADINLNGSETNQWTSIGNDTTQFAGTFDGNNKEITGLYVNQTLTAEGNAYAGLFGYIADGTIKNLTVSGAITVSKTAEVGVDIYIGGVVARANRVNSKVASCVENCENKCTITVPEISGTDHPRYIGGVIGYNYENSVKDCKNSGTISVSKVTGALIGGVVGYSYTGFSKIENCTNTAAITGSTVKQSKIEIENNRTRYYGAIGGVIGYEGYTYKGLSNCLNKGNVTAKDGSCVVVGGVAGYHYLRTENCRNEGDVSNDTLYDSSISTSGNYATGGVVGYNYSKVVNCSNSGNVTGKYKVGGVVGRVKGDVIQCYNTGNVTFLKNATKYWNNQLGGVVGTYDGLLDIKNCYNTGTITFDDDENYELRVGGIVADCFNSSTIISECYNMGKIQKSNTSESTNTMVGVIIGKKDSSVTVSNCYYLDSWNSSSAITATDTDLATSKTSSDFASGEVAHVLQNAQDDSTKQVWGQKLGTDNNPILTSEGEKKVYKITFLTTEKNTESDPYAVRYSNKSFDEASFPSAPDNKYEYLWSLTNDVNGTKFDKNTEITEDTTVYGVKKEITEASNKSDIITLNKNKEIATPIDLSDYVQNKSGNETKNFAFYLEDENTLPDGLEFDESTGKITGTPTKLGTYTVKFNVANSGISLMSLESVNNVDVLTLTVYVDLENDTDGAYLIKSLDDFEYFRDKVNGGTTYEGKYVKLTVDIDMTGYYGFRYGR